MKRHAHFALVLLAFLAACGGKRPPAVADAPGSGRPTPPPVTRAETLEGPDVRPVDAGGGLTEGELSDVSGEGGPLEDIHFDYDSAALTDAARATLERHAAWIKARSGLKVVVEGHCDERGTVEYNLALGDQRARAARDYLVNLGVPASILSAVSFGKERPLDPASNEAAWAKNRRGHFAVSR
ncbi:MAG TPA: peptidoglycan-associated lipoprotein Pal [Vicinamibacteria bacterium]|nr:peptidoglycan-associated lipoprotein Pal [Vicinamibacteria bacterium]